MFLERFYEVLLLGASGGEAVKPVIFLERFYIVLLPAHRHGLHYAPRIPRLGNNLAEHNSKISRKTPCKAENSFYTLSRCTCGRSSVVERHVANVNVVSSNLIARF